MPRTLNATLEAALDSGSFQPYFLLTVREVGFSILETAQPFQFKLSGINLEAKWVRQQGSVYEGFNYPHELEFKITRGVTIAGINYTIDSSYYYGLTQVWDGIFQTVTACMLKAQKYTAAADVTYKTLIDALCTAQGKTAVYYTVGAAWQSYKFLGSGKVLNLNRAYDVLNMLKQKYLIFACDNGNDQILFKAVGTDADGSADHTLAIGLFEELGYDTAAYRRFLYRVEAATIHYDGNANDPLWNLGYLESTASPPVSNVSFPFRLKPIAPHLKYLSFDQFAFTFGNYPNSLYTNDSRNLQVTEEFNTEFKELAWRIILNTYDWSRGTEGGALPGTIEAAAPFTPLNTTNFDGILTTNDNNIQAAMETIDDHGHTAKDFALTGDITPTALSADQNDYNPTGLSTASVLRLEASGAARSITGLAGGTDGRIIVIHNIGATYALYLINETGGGASAAANRFALGGGTLTITPNYTVILQYDSTSSRWRVLGTSAKAIQGATIDPALLTVLTDGDILYWNAGDAVFERKAPATLLFSDSEGDPANIGTAAADGTSTYAARRDHVHRPGAWTSYTPTWSSTGTAPALGNGTIAGKYLRIGPIVFYKIALTWGSTTTGGTGAWTFTLPVTALDTTAYSEPGGAVLNDASVGQKIGQTLKLNSTTIYVQTDASPNGIGQGTDFTWTTSDSLLIAGNIEA